MYIGLHVKYPLFCPILMKLGFSGQIFEKYSNIKFNENPCSGSRVVTCGREDMMKLIVAFLSFANAPKQETYSSLWCINSPIMRQIYVSY